MSDKTEDPTARRLAKAREKGDVAVSGVTSQSIGFLVAVLMVPAAVAATATRANELLRWAIAGQVHVDAMSTALESVVALTAPLIAAAAAASVLSTVVQTGGMVAPARLAPDLAKLDPLAGLRSLVSPARLWNVARALLSAIVVGCLAWDALRRHTVDLAHAVGRSGPAGAIADAACRRVARGAVIIGIAFAVVDWVVVRRTLRVKLRMTKAEVKREHRESEGDPQLKAARHRAHRDMLAAATINAVRDATVVIVNPEHLATALRYVEGEDDAPKVIASADGELAQRIQEAARAYGIPIVRDVPVARALCELEVGDTIPDVLFEAVAEILREIWETEGTELRT